jgi:hypothetical protein
MVAASRTFSGQMFAACFCARPQPVQWRHPAPPVGEVDLQRRRVDLPWEFDLSVAPRMAVSAVRIVARLP